MAAPSQLVQKQWLFSANVGRLLLWSHSKGYRLTLGEAHRPPEVAQLYAAQGRGIANSVHTVRLAIDLLLFLDGVYQRDSAAYKPLGDYWKTLHEDNRWGGDFKRPDGNHFSMIWQGRA